MIKRDDAQTCAQRRQWGTFVELASDEADRPEDAARRPTFLDAVIYRLKTGVLWRDLPSGSARWKSVYNRFANWSRRGLWRHIFESLQLDVDDEGSIVDASSSARTKTLRAEGGPDQLFRFVAGGFSTKIPRRRGTCEGGLCLSPGRPASVTKPPSPSSSSSTRKAGLSLADTAYDSSELDSAARRARYVSRHLPASLSQTSRRPPSASCTASASSSYSSITKRFRAPRHPLRKTARHASRCSTSPAPSSGSLGTALGCLEDPFVHRRGAHRPINQRCKVSRLRMRFRTASLTGILWPPANIKHIVGFPLGHALLIHFLLELSGPSGLGHEYLASLSTVGLIAQQKCRTTAAHREQRLSRVIFR